jgi:hypothetical protein
VGEGCLVSQTLGVLTGGDQERGCRIGSNAFHGNQLRREFTYQPIQLLIELGDLLGCLLPVVCCDRKWKVL